MLSSDYFVAFAFRLLALRFARTAPSYPPPLSSRKGVNRQRESFGGHHINSPFGFATSSVFHAEPSQFAEGFDQIDRQRKNSCRVLFSGDFGQRLEIAELECDWALAHDFRG